MNKVWPIIAVLMLCLNSYGSTMENLIRFLNPDINKIEEDIERLKKEVEALPPYSIGYLGNQKGLHTPYYTDQNTPFEATIDLGKKYDLDMIAFFPASSTFQGKFVHGYGLPEEFIIESSNSKDFSESTELYKHDQNSTYFGLYPILLKEVNKKARFIRVRILKHWKRSDGKIFSAFSEIKVISNKRNVALHKKVKADAKILPLKWKPAYIVDGQTDWGAPISIEPSKTNGFVSLQASNPVSEKWVVLDLGKEHELIDVRLVPAQPFDAPNNKAHGFPRSFKIETSLSEDFKNSKLIANERFFNYPGGNAIIYNKIGKARFVRLTASRLPPVMGENRFAMALSEIQAYTEEGNVALNCKVITNDEANFPNFKHVWGKQYLVDGYNSQNKLIELNDWLIDIDKKRTALSSIASLKAKFNNEFRTTKSGIIYAVSFLAVILALLLGFNRYQRTQKLKAEVEKLRTQISRDLHDDLGSRLGGIRLLSQVALDDPDLNETAREDLELINNSAIGAVEAMRDIVWLTDGKDIDAKDLAKHLHTVSVESLNKFELNWKDSCLSPLTIPFYLRRHLAFAFRESLGNILKHSKATEVSVEVVATKDEFSFKVSDNGCGFDPEKVSSGNGLSNFKQRAKNIKGSCDIFSSPGKGTTINFKADLQVQL